MTKRLQVLFEDEELREIQRLAKRSRMTTAAWVRRAVRSARDADGASSIAEKLAAIRTAAGYDLPTADVDSMLDEIERGYLEPG